MDSRLEHLNSHGHWHTDNKKMGRQRCVAPMMSAASHSYRCNPYTTANCYACSPAYGASAVAVFRHGRPPALPADEHGSSPHMVRIQADMVCIVALRRTCVSERRSELWHGGIPGAQPYRPVPWLHCAVRCSIRVQCARLWKHVLQIQPDWLYYTCSVNWK